MKQTRNGAIGHSSLLSFDSPALPSRLLAFLPAYIRGASADLPPCPSSSRLSLYHTFNDHFSTCFRQHYYLLQLESLMFLPLPSRPRSTPLFPPRQQFHCIQQRSSLFLMLITQFCLLFFSLSVVVSWWQSLLLFPLQSHPRHTHYTSVSVLHLLFQTH